MAGEEEKTTIGVILYSAKMDPIIYEFIDKSDIKYKPLARFALEKLQIWIDNKKIPVKYDESEKRFLVSSFESGTNFDPRTDEFWEFIRDLYCNYVQIKRVQ